MLMFATGLVLGALAGLIVTALSIWHVRDHYEAEMARQLRDARKSSAEKDLEIERLDGLNVELRAEVVFLRGDGPRGAA